MTRQSTKDFFKEYFSKEEPKKKLFKPNIEEDLNRPHKVTLTEGQISTILYILEGYNPLDSNGYDPEFREDIDNICEILEGKIDSYYESNSETNKNLSEITPERDAKAVENNTSKVILTPQELEGDISTIKDSDYEEESNTEASEDSDDKYNFVEHTSECA